MSEEHNEDDKKRAAGGGFEQGLKSALEKAPGMVVPSWATMQTAMAGGAAGGAAAASWRWIIGPAATAALMGGAFWLSEPSSTVEETANVTEQVDLLVQDERIDGMQDGTLDSQSNAGHMGLGGELGSPEAADMTVSGESRELGEVDVDMTPEPVSESQSAGRSTASFEEAVEVPADWAELPAEKAAAFAVDVSSACVGTEIGFRMAKAMKDVRVLWNFGDGQFSSQAEPSHVFKAPGTYDITLSVTRISDGLIRTRTIENLVTIYPNPEADFTWEVPSTAEADPVIRMRDRSRDAAQSTWIVDGDQTSGGDAVDFQLPKVGEHVVQLVASSPQGCQSVASHLIEVGSRFGIGGSSRFSPDGDGRYDTFLPRKLAQMERPFVFRVEDASGHIVFETTEPRAWDGSLPEHGRAAPGERYSWTVVLQGEVGPAYYSDVVIIE